MSKKREAVQTRPSGGPGAHPRSRGENVTEVLGRRRREGSSPLTRGKPRMAHQHPKGPRLIPAHAGKTEDGRAGRGMTGAHPRSRGENVGHGVCPFGGGGSSPLTRGKHWPTRTAIYTGGLIPAHAGKTSPREPHHANSRAHPRSRGENCARASAAFHATGSSPLTRGKHVLTHPPRGRTGLIPAHAGKTLPDLRFYRADRSDLGKP